MKFCTKCGRGLDVNRRFCTGCGAPNIFYVVERNDAAPRAEQVREDELRSKALLDEVAKEEARRESEQLEKLRIEKDRLEQLRLERERIELARLEEERRERLELEKQQLLAEAQKRKEQQMREMYEAEQRDILGAIRKEREQLKGELEEIARLRVTANTVKEVTPVATKPSVFKKIFTTLLIFTLLGALGVGGYYLYAMYMTTSSFDLAQDAIAKQEWLTARGHLSQVVRDYEGNKLHLTSDEIYSVRKWQQATQQLWFVSEAIGNAVGRTYKPAEYKSLTDKISKIDFGALETAKLPNVDAYRSAHAVTILIDSFRLLSIEQFISETGAVKQTDKGIVYSQSFVTLNIDTEIVCVMNKDAIAIEPIYSRVIAAMQAVNTSALPAITVTKGTKPSTVKSYTKTIVKPLTEDEEGSGSTPQRDID